ncbi:MAG: hypothetical protein ABIB43_03705 [archaeon]
MSIIGDLKSIDEIDNMYKVTKYDVQDEIIEVYLKRWKPEQIALKTELLEEVYNGKTTFQKELDKLGTDKFLKAWDNMSVFSGNVFLGEEVKYLDKKIKEIRKYKRTGSW